MTRRWPTPFYVKSNVGVTFKSVIVVHTQVEAEEAVQSLRHEFAEYIYGEYRAPLREAQRLSLEGDRMGAGRAIETILKSMEI